MINIYLRFRNTSISFRLHIYKIHDHDKSDCRKREIKKLPDLTKKTHVQTKRILLHFRNMQPQNATDDFYIIKKTVPTTLIR